MKICFVSGSRADYGLLYLLMKLIKNDPKIKFQLIVTGSHLSKKHGSTFKEIIKDKFIVDYFINIDIKNDKPKNICNSVSLAVIKISRKLEILKPDLIVLLGDRYEIFAACTSAYIHQIPICHLHGGELTSGSIDDSFRHSITKMSNVHFAAHKVYANRIVQLGENPKNIHVVGGFGVDLIKSVKLLKKKDIENNLNFKFGKKNILVTFHPETISNSNNKKSFNEILKALHYLKDYNIIFTKANSDTDGLIINKMINKFEQKHKDRCVTFNSMGQLNYLSTIKYVDFIIGNSSSGLTEVPTFKKPTINVGNRQNHRLKSSSVIDVKSDFKKILLAVKKTNLATFKTKLKKVKNLYGDEGASKKTYNIIKKLDLKKISNKKFFDLKK